MEFFTTADGGNNWTLSSEASILFSCTRPSLNLCFAVGGFDLLKSTDKGFTWIRHPISDNYYFMSISFFDTLNGIASASRKFFRTFDGGETWQLTDSIEVDYIHDICFADSSTIYACSNAGKIYKSSDGGFSWEVQNTGLSGVILYGIQFINRDLGYATGSNTIIKTTNGGQNWILISGGLQNGGRQINFKDENNGLIAGGTVSHTSNGGLTWNSYEPFNDFMSVAMVNDSIWYAVGGNGAILKTTTSGVVPVELFSFAATRNVNEVILNWSTATETNNSGFEILRFTQNDKNEWQKIGFVPGHGTTTETQHYSFTDNDIKPGKYQYKLKQIDYDGTFEYSQIVEVKIPIVNKFSLSQNYPNPFNPSTVISYRLPVIGLVTLKVYDILGKEVATLLNEEKPAGEYEVEFDGRALTGGIYFYQLKAGSYSETKKMVLLK